MIKKQFLIFLFRWFVSSVIMWICINAFGSIDAGYNSFWLYPAAGLVMSLVNAIVQPIATLFSLPLIILSMGLFMEQLYLSVPLTHPYATRKEIKLAELANLTMLLRIGSRHLAAISQSTDANKVYCSKRLGSLC